MVYFLPMKRLRKIGKTAWLWKGLFNKEWKYIGSTDEYIEQERVIRADRWECEWRYRVDGYERTGSNKRNT